MKRLFPLLFLVFAFMAYVACERQTPKAPLSEAAKKTDAKKAVITPKAEVSNKLANLKNRSASTAKPLSAEEIAKKFPDGKYPILTATEAEFDFGTVQEGDDATHVFTLRNTGKAMLNIEKAKGS